MDAQVDPNQLPSVTRARFAVLFTIVSLLAFATGSNAALFLDQTGGNANGLYSGALTVVLLIFVAALYYIFHPIVRARSFGRHQVLERDSAIEHRIYEICRRLSVPQPRLLIDNDIRNYDAIAFGLPGRYCVLLGRGLRLLYATKPGEFDARLAHEIGHIRNRDIATTFWAEGLIFGGIALLILANVRAIGPVLSTLPDTRHVLGFLLNLIAAAFWAAILISEHRAFLRVREFYADIASAQTFGPEAIRTTLGNDEGLDPWYHRLFDAHPSVSLRKSVIDQPVLLYEPTISRLWQIGYAFGLLAAVLTTVHNLPDVDAGHSLISLTRLGFTTLPGAVLFGVFVVVFLPFAIAGGSLVFRIAAWLKLDRLTAGEKFTRCAKGILALTVAIYCGLHLNPVMVSTIANEPWRINSMLDEADGAICLITAFQVSCALLLAIPIVRRLLTAPRDTPPSKVTWFFVGATFYVAIGYIGEVANAFTDPSIPDLPTTFAVIAFVLALAMPFLIISYLISRRSLQIGLLPASSLAPWVQYRPNRQEPF